MLNEREAQELVAKRMGALVEWRDDVQCLCFTDKPGNIPWAPIRLPAQALEIIGALEIKIILGYPPEIGAKATSATAIYQPFQRGWQWATGHGCVKSGDPSDTALATAICRAVVWCVVDLCEIEERHKEHPNDQ